MLLDGSPEGYCRVCNAFSNPDDEDAEDEYIIFWEDGEALAEFCGEYCLVQFVKRAVRAGIR